ncbi:MAG TPA: FliI/YscN family ATPase [Polyangiales bacterium]
MQPTPPTTQELVRIQGRVRAARGLTVLAHVPGARRGDWVRIERAERAPLDAEVIAFEEDLVTLMPLGDVRGVGSDDRVIWMGSSFRFVCGDALLGRVLDGLGRACDGGPAPEGALCSLLEAAPRAHERPRIRHMLPTGVNAIDALCTMAEGQRLGIFAAAGVGKTTLLARIAQHAQADVIVICLIGERGRELNELRDEALNAETRARSVIVCATSDAPALERVKSAHTATRVAEHFRAQGKRVLLLMDSLTRLVRAAREVGLSAGEAPARRGFPPSAFAELAPLLERAGLTREGSITAFYTVLVEGNDLDEPVADEARGLLDGHLVLDRALAERGHYPAIDVPRSVSRLMASVVSPSHRDAAARVRAWLARYYEKRDLVELGAVPKGADPLLDRALAKLPEIHALIRQEHASLPAPELIEQLCRVAQ